MINHAVTTAFEEAKELFGQYTLGVLFQIVSVPSFSTNHTVLNGSCSFFLSGSFLDYDASQLSKDEKSRKCLMPVLLLASFAIACELLSWSEIDGG